MEDYLIHFTSKDGLEKILETGVVLPRDEVGGTRILWLTESSRPRDQKWAVGPHKDKLEFRMVLHLGWDDVVPWYDFVLNHQLEELSVEKAAPDSRMPRQWYVTDYAVDRASWVSITHIPTGRRLWHPGKDS